MKDWGAVAILFIAGICGGAGGYFSAPLFVDDLADILRPITAACGVPIGLLVGTAIARLVFGEKKAKRAKHSDCF